MSTRENRGRISDRRGAAANPYNTVALSAELDRDIAAALKAAAVAAAEAKDAAEHAETEAQILSDMIEMNKELLEKYNAGHIASSRTGRMSRKIKRLPVTFQSNTPLKRNNNYEWTPTQFKGMRNTRDKRARNNAMKNEAEINRGLSGVMINNNLRGYFEGGARKVARKRRTMRK